MICSELVVLLSEDDKKILTEKISNNGYDTIDELIKHLQISLNQDMDFTLIDVDTICSFDLCTNYKIFITENEIMTREEIIEKYNLTKFKLEPELLFNHQKIEVIDNDYFIFDKESETRDSNSLYNTKIYIGKERWKDFMITFRFMRSLLFISENRLAITDTEKNKNNEYIDKVIDQVLLNNGSK